MKRNLAKFAVLALILSMIIAPNSVYGQSQAESLKEIATKARDQLRFQLSQIDDVSEDLKSKFKEASLEIELIEMAAKNDDLSKARQHFLTAMKIFQQITQEISEQITQGPLTATQSTPINSDELKRLENYVDRLKNIANRNQIEIDFSNAEKLIDSAKEAFKEDEQNKANSIIDEIKREIINLNNSLKEKTREATVEKAKSFAEKHLEELETLISQAKEIGVSEQTIERMEKAKGDLGDSSNIEQIIKEVKHLISVKEEFENNKAQRIKSRINQLESKYDNLLTNSDSNNSDLEKAKTMFSELTTLVSKGQLNEAIRLLTSLDDILKNIENSIKEEKTVSTQVEESKDEPESTLSLSDSKVERIKIKIERLEIHLTQLSEKIEDDGAVKRWLENGITLLENAKAQLKDSPERSLKTISKIEQIIQRIEKMI